ncbi:MAG: undecaprenyldiphospho-muramoylpentapeptide beta-N-acetylglucosaminyltransferase [Candidatus Aminicenantes bacterium]|nr:undecaprenyldiphospho-muramoylpentapeptide beta-N-acetylglucosaminyltransferase [Candidatus Aminicenantes bacterium]
MSRKKVFISGGGTGGHLYPALVLGQTLKNMRSDLQVFYIGSNRPVEKKIMAEQALEFSTLPVEALKGRRFKKIYGLALLPLAFLKSFFLLLKHRPVLVVGVGGFSSGPMVLTASLLGIPTLIMEQNALPGFTNRKLKRWANRVVVAFESSLTYFGEKAVALGNPVREEFYHLPEKQKEDRLTILVFGGSQGSKFLNETMTASLPWLKEIKDKVKIYHQTGEKDFERVATAYREQGLGEAVVAKYFSPMPDYFTLADLVICRAGATTCAELIAASKPAILVPFAQAADNHQEYNAKELEKVGGAVVLLEKECTPEKLAQKIKHFIDNQEKLKEMAESLKKLKKENVAENIARLALEMIEEKERRK